MSTHSSTLARRTEIIEAHNAGDLAIAPARRAWQPTRPQDKWTPSLLPAAALGTYSELIGGGEEFVPLETSGDTTLGMVTGNNKFFTLSPARVAELGLAPTDLLRLYPPGSRHLRGLSFTTAAWHDLGERDAATWLFRPTDEPSPAGRAHIEAAMPPECRTPTSAASDNRGGQCRSFHPRTCCSPT